METAVPAKPRFMSELAYVLAIPLLALGVTLMEKADFGVSMVVAPAYILHLKLVTLHPFFTFGALEYMVQGALLLVLCLVLGRFRPAYLFSFVTAVIYGFVKYFYMFISIFVIKFHIYFIWS